ncbi:hypothetical protein O7602_30705 [Micromonospora sp. WMMD1128]|uniref:hypothetical protein n=1 Tax=Micromonospora sp. WMMD1128 TaxID=3015150 RepID=UPI00248B2C2B|nr:hypothetical protein [Micromonospora sp. WMMD1128]WBB73963.1 hypothetical protein O7602_30705 [Micromonospora sp. WMMD1128]
MLTRLATALLLLLASGCTDDASRSRPTTSSRPPGQVTFQPPEWLRMPPTRLGTIGVDLEAVGWDGGFLLAHDAGGLEGRDEETYTSTDGRTWHLSTPKGTMKPPSCCDRFAAAYGEAAYLLGWDTRNDLVVRRTEDGDTWDTTRLEFGDLAVRYRGDLAVAIAAGPEGVLVVGRDAVTPARHHGVYVWYSPDGHTFTAMVKVPGPVDPDPPLTTLAATPDGFLLAMTTAKETKILFSRDNGRWQDITEGLGDVGAVDHVSGNADTTVLLAHRAGSEEPLAWYRRQGKWRRATIEPGHLPDAGVVPPDQRRVAAVRTWGSGFVAVGHTYGSDGQEQSGLVWYSVDGSGWKRMPVRDNGFDTAWPLLDLAISRQLALLVGWRLDRAEPPEWLVTWQADSPPMPKRAHD